MKQFVALLLALLCCLTGALAEAPGIVAEEDIEEILLDDEPESETAEAPVSESVSTEAKLFIPSRGSAYPITENTGDYWSLPMDITDEEAVWNMLMAPITVVDIGKNSSPQRQTYLYQEPDTNSKKVGVVTCESQGVRVIEQLDNGWTLVECYSSSFHATKVEAWNLLVSGYIQTDYLKTVEPDDTLGIVVDKLTQRLYLFQDGHLLSTLMCSTGLVMWNGSKYQPYNETRSGEFLSSGKGQRITSDELICSYTIRFNDGDMIHEVPHVVKTNASGKKESIYSTWENKLGTKCSHGCIRVQRNLTPEGINMKWIWDQLTNDSKVKIVIWEDWQGRQIPTPDPDTVLYYNPNKGTAYHRAEHCSMAKSNITFEPFLYSQLEEAPYSKLKYCAYCCPELRQSQIDAINATYAFGGDHEELLNKLRAKYFTYLEQ